MHHRAHASLVFAFGLLTACGSSPSPEATDARATATDATTTDAAATDAPATDAAATDARDATPTDAPATDAPATDGAGGVLGAAERARLNGLVEEVARGVCDALYRCCDATSRAAYFAPMRTQERLASLRDRIPVDGALDQGMCPMLLADVFRVVPLGGWVSAALEGRVAFRASEADQCLARLRTAACGGEVSTALADGTCFGFSPPLGGAAQRRMFVRTSTEGASCTGIADGVGGALYGTCDPSQAFCCNAASGRCLPAGAAVGTCRPAGRVGAACGISPELRICATGLECDASTGRCAAPVTASLRPGDRCAMGTTLLGECQESFCDLGATDRCVALIANGGTCSFAYECQSGQCSTGRCAASTFCVRPG